MLRTRHILFPYDFSERCAAAAPLVAAMARRFGSRITMLSVVPPVWQNSSSEPKTAAALYDPQRLQATLDRALVDEFSGIKVERIAQKGDPAAVIVAFAHHDFGRGKSVDMIMMPTHGLGPFRTLLLGSVTAKVLHDARCPVWTAAHAEVGPEYRDGPSPALCAVVLCAVDGTPKSVPLMKWAAEWAHAVGAKLRLVHAVSSVTDLPILKSERALQEEVRKEAEAAVEKQRREAGIEAALCVETGPIADVVHQEALRQGAGLMVIGRGALHGTLGRLRTHAYGIIRRSPCPVLSV